MISEKTKQTIKLIASISILVLLFLFVIIMMLKYNVEGETNMPFKLSKIVIIGTVEGVENKTENNTKWNFNIEQNNDVYFYIDKNEKYNFNEEELIKSVKIENIKIVDTPKKGNIQEYMPNSTGVRLFTNEEQFKVENGLEYRGAEQSSTTNLQIGSQGGTALIRFSNNNIGNYVSDSDEEIIHNNSLLKKIETTNEEIKFKVSFDFIIETTKTKYKANIQLEFPTGNLDEEENCYIQNDNLDNIIFKRIK